MTDSSLDTFFDIKTCIDRLYCEWKKHPKLIIAVDFDDTVFDFHNRNQVHDNVINLLHECKKEGFYIVVFTASKPERYDFIKDYMEMKGIEIDGINKNVIELPYGNNGKIYYNILLDDRAGLFQAVTILTSVLFKIRNKA